MENTTTYTETKETFANELVLKYGYLIDPIASGLIGNRTFMDRNDLHQQGILVIMEGVKYNKLKFPYPITSEADIISTLTEYLTKELSLYIKNIDSYMSRKVRCNRISNRNKEKIMSENLFKDCESTVDKKILHELMYHGGKLLIINSLNTSAFIIFLYNKHSAITSRKSFASLSSVITISTGIFGNTPIVIRYTTKEAAVSYLLNLPP